MRTVRVAPGTRRSPNTAGPPPVSSTRASRPRRRISAASHSPPDRTPSGFWLTVLCLRNSRKPSTIPRRFAFSRLSNVSQGGIPATITRVTPGASALLAVRGEHSPNGPVQVGQRERLCEDRHRALGEKAAVLGLVRGSADEEQAREKLGPPPFDLPVEANPVEFRHAEVADDQVVGPRLDLVEGEAPVRGRLHLIPIRFQHLDEHLGNGGLVLDDEDS